MATISPQFPLSRHRRPLSFSANLESRSSLFLFRTTPSSRTSLSNPIGCRVTAAQPASDASAASELQGTGAAAPSRGQIFLEHQQAKAAATAVLKQEKKEQAEKKKNKRNKLGAGINNSTATSCCYGCGAPLQTVEIDAPGYVDLETYELKKKHRQLKTVLCGRCKLLSHGHMVTAVGGHGGYNGGKQFVSAEELREKLAHLRNEKALIVKLVDIVDFNGSFLARVRDLAGSNPIILVITKVDLLPKGTDLNCIGDWVVEASVKKKLNVISVHLTSSKSLVGIVGVISEIQKEKKGRDVYILGAANVGKSAFINAMLKMMAHKDPVAAAARKYKPIQSAVPGTTLGPIEIEAFQGGGKIFDTPGVHLHHRQAAVVHSDDLPYLAPRSRLSGHSFSVETINKMKNSIKFDMNDLSIFWGGLVRIDIQKVLSQTRLTFYGPKAVQPLAVLSDEANKFYQKELGKSLTPPTGNERAELWPGLQTTRQLKIPFYGYTRPACDIAISGLGWIVVEPMAKSLETPDQDQSEEASGELEFTVHIHKGVEVFVRPSLPVGQSGGEWYEYRELSEEEEELRPKWFF